MENQVAQQSPSKISLNLKEFIQKANSYWHKSDKDKFQLRGQLRGQTLRLVKQLNDYVKNPMAYVLALGPWNCVFYVQEGTFKGGYFAMKIKAPNYPFKPPQFRFLTKIYSPLISREGNICCCTTKTDDRWSPTNTISKIINMIKQKVFDQKYDSINDCILDSQIGNIKRTNIQQYKKTVKQWIQLYASQNQSIQQ